MKRFWITLTSPVLVLLALVVGAMPASARSAAGGGARTPALIVEPAQPGPPTDLMVTGMTDSTVNLSWIAPVELTSSDAGSPSAGYNVYQGTQASGEDMTSPVNGGSPVTTTNYTVTGLNRGTQYFFVVTAVDAAGTESDPSNEASATPGSGVTVGPSITVGGVTVGPSTTVGGVTVGPPTGGTGSSVSPAVFIGPLGVGAVIVGTLVMRRRRRSRSAPVPQQPQQPVPGPTVRAEPHAGPPGAVSVRTTGKGSTHTVRIVPYPGASTTTIKEPLP